MQFNVNILVSAIVFPLVSARLLGPLEEGCSTLQSGNVVDKVGNPIGVGVDTWGYNYQAHAYNGLLCNYLRPDPPLEPGDTGCEIHLAMKWNEAWISNLDCDGDGKLDRHRGHVTYIGSGAWLTNHMRGEYDENGKRCQWTDFLKIIAVPSSSVIVDNHWLDPDGNDLGEVIWGEFAITEEVYNDPCDGTTGLLARAVRPGLGNWED